MTYRCPIHGTCTYDDPCDCDGLPEFCRDCADVNLCTVRDPDGECLYKEEKTIQMKGGI